MKDNTKKEKVTPFIYLLSSFYQTLMQKNYQSNFTIGIPASNRDSEGADKMMGQCSNLVTFEINAPVTQAFPELIKQVKEEMIQTFSHMIHPYEDLEKFTGKALFNITFNMEPTTDLPDFGEVSLFLHPFPISVSEFEMTINVSDMDYYYHCEVDYRTDLLTEAEVLQLSKEFNDIIRRNNLLLKKT